MELSRDLMARMHDNAMCVAQSSLVVDYSTPASTAFYSYAGKSSSSPAPGTSCSSGDDESCGSGGSLRVTTATEALRCRYGDEMLTGTAAAASSDRQQAALTLGRRTDTSDGGIDVEVSADYDDEIDERQRHSSATPSTHRKHKAQKQVRASNVLLLYYGNSARGTLVDYCFHDRASMLYTARYFSRLFCASVRRRP